MNLVQNRTVLVDTFGASEGAGLRLKQAALIVAGIALLAICAKIKVPVPGSPVAMSLGTFAVLTVGAAYGPRLGLATIMGYMILGMLGMDIFQNSTADLNGISYEYADGFLGGIRAYEAAGLPLDVELTLRTDEFGLFCEWQEIGNPNFEIFFSSGGGFDSRIALTAGMMALNGAEIDPNIVVPAAMRQVDETSCNPDAPGEAPASTLVPDDVLAAMYPS